MPLKIAVEIEGFEVPVFMYVDIEGFKDPLVAFEKMGVFDRALTMKVRIDKRELKVHSEPRG